MAAEIQEVLDEGIALLRAGNRDEARQKLMQVIKADERNESAWLYLSEAVDSDEDRQICLENVLTINPANERAERELTALQEKAEQQELEESGFVCLACGATNPPDTQRCLNCYAALDEPISAPTSTQAESPPAEASIGEQPSREVRHKSFMEMLDTWAEMFMLPGQARLDEEHAYARWGLTAPGVLVASAITYFFVSLINVGTTLLTPGGTTNLAQLVPIVCGGVVIGAVIGLISFLINSGFYYLIARLLKGEGQFDVQSYLLSLVYGPYSLAFAIFSPLLLLTAINPVLGFIPFLIVIPIAILAFIMTVRAFKSTHGYGTGAALGTIFLPGLFFCCLGVMISLLAGSALTTLPFTFSEFQ